MEVKILTYDQYKAKQIENRRRLAKEATLDIQSLKSYQAPKLFIMGNGDIDDYIFIIDDKQLLIDILRKISE